MKCFCIPQFRFGLCKFSKTFTKGSGAVIFVGDTAVKASSVDRNFSLSRAFHLWNGWNARRRHSASRPEVSGKTAFFPRNDRPYGLKCKAFQTEIALDFPSALESSRPATTRHRHSTIPPQSLSSTFAGRSGERTRRSGGDRKMKNITPEKYGRKNGKNWNGGSGNAGKRLRLALPSTGFPRWILPGISWRNRNEREKSGITGQTVSAGTAGMASLFQSLDRQAQSASWQSLAVPQTDSSRRGGQATRVL